MSFNAAHSDFSQTVTLARAHRHKRSRLAHHAVTTTQRARFFQTLCSQTSNLFVRREDERERAIKTLGVRRFNCGERGADEAFRITRAATVELALKRREPQSFRPRSIKRHCVRVTDQRQLYRVVKRFRPQNRHHVDFLDTLLVHVRKKTHAHPGFGATTRKIFYDGAVRIGRNRVERDQLAQRLFNIHDKYSIALRRRSASVWD